MFMIFFTPESCGSCMAHLPTSTTQKPTIFRPKVVKSWIEGWQMGCTMYILPMELRDDQSYPLANQHKYGTSPFSMGKSTINCHFPLLCKRLPEGTVCPSFCGPKRDRRSPRKPRTLLGGSLPTNRTMGGLSRGVLFTYNWCELTH